MKLASLLTRMRPRRSPGLGLLLIIACTIVLATAPLFLGPYIIGLMARAFCFALLVITVELLWGYTGVLSLGQSAFFGIGAYSIGISFSHIIGDWAGAGLGMAAGIIVALAVALALGWFIFYARTSLVFPFYVSVVTLAVGAVFYQAVLSGGNLTGASQGLSGFKTLEIGQSSWYWILLILLVTFGYLAYLLVVSDTGVVLIAIRENEERSRYLGYHTPRIKTLLFAACAALAAISGGLYALYTTIVAPSLVGITLGTDAVIWTALGGRGTLVGPILGAVVVNVVGPTLNASFPFLWQLLLGVMFVVVVTAAPMGILPLLWKPIVRSRTAQDLEIEDSGSRFEVSAAQDVPRPPFSGAALQVKDVNRSFGSLRVLRNVTLEASRGELVSIVGPNGAGKTTLIKCIADGNERSGGTVLIDGVDIDRKDPQSVVTLGVGRKFQTANVFNSLTVADCLRLASWKGRPLSVLRRSKKLVLPRAARMVVEATGLTEHMGRLSGQLGHGLRQALELAMVLALEPTVLLLDEPTAGLSKEDRNRIADILAAIRASGEMCIILIEHDFDFVKQISSRMIVLHQGEVVMDGTVEEVANAEIVRAIYLGHAHEAAS